METAVLNKLWLSEYLSAVYFPQRRSRLMSAQVAVFPVIPQTHENVSDNNNNNNNNNRYVWSNFETKVFPHLICRTSSQLMETFLTSLEFSGQALQKWRRPQPRHWASQKFNEGPLNHKKNHKAYEQIVGYFCKVKLTSILYLLCSFGLFFVNLSKRLHTVFLFADLLLAITVRSTLF